jgi:hypothetical protein
MNARRMSLEDACTFVPDDLPDGAYWAMAHEIAGAEYGDAWDELSGHPEHNPRAVEQRLSKPHVCRWCQKRFKTSDGMSQHAKDIHPKAFAREARLKP